MPNPVTVADVADRYWVPLTDQQTANVGVWVGDAWELLTTRRPGLEAAVSAGTVSQRNVVRVVSSMVIRVLDNPAGKSEESIDDYRYKRDQLVASGVLHVTDAELGVLTPSVVGGRRSVRLVVYGDD